MSPGRRWVPAALLAGLSAVSLARAFPPADLELVAWVALAPMIVAVTTGGPLRAYLLGGGAGAIFFAGVFSWIWTIDAFNRLDFVVLELYFSQYFALFALLLNLATRRAGVPVALAAPVLWVSLEYLRVHLGFLSLPMALLGHSQHRQLSLIQIASITGVWGLSFVVVVVNAALAELALALRRPGASWSLLAGTARVRRAVWSAAGAVLVLGGSLLYGARVLAEPGATKGLTIGVLQRDLPPQPDPDTESLDEMIDRHLELSRQLLAVRPGLIVWPESSVPAPLRAAPDLLAPIATFARETESYLLVGTSESEKFAPASASPASPSPASPSKIERFNTAVLISPQGTIEAAYHKTRLVPFGEYVPLKGLIAWPSWLVGAADELTPGRELTIFRLPAATFGVVICWESLFPDLVRALVQRGAQFLVNITNESWFNPTAAEQLAAISVFRAVEHRTAVVRSANGGLSSFIEPDGRVTVRLPRGDAVTSGAVVLSRGPTFYTANGDVLAHLCIVAAAIAVGLSARRRRG